MPCFHTHWLVALRVVDSMSDDDDLSVGKRSYLRLCGRYREKLYAALMSCKSGDDFLRSFTTIAADLEDKLCKPPDYDPITCFSAYMLGACGPDFWMLMSKEGFPSGDHTDGTHFDLGHYNRTHQQFNVSGKRLRSSKQWTLTQRAERAYFAGMATHIATDLVMHQLVNVYAGGYSLLEKRWSPEHGFTSEIPYLARRLHTHNKIEQWWDTYVRYRWLGDYGTVWRPDEAPGGEVFSLPLAESVIRAAFQRDKKKLDLGRPSSGRTRSPMGRTLRVRLITSIKTDWKTKVS